MSMPRSAGILLPIFSLPSKYGIGTIGEEAYRFVDFLVEARQSYWQILPLGPTSYGDSPYMSFSSYAGNPYFIDLDMLVEDNLLTEEDLKQLPVNDEERVDYGAIYQSRFEVLYKAYLKGRDLFGQEYKKFVSDNANWLEDYAMFMAIKKHFSMQSWIEWPDKDIRLRKEDAMKHYRQLLDDDVEFYQFIQFLFYRQYTKFKEYANKNKIKIIGDVPIYVALDSADTWSHPEVFQLDEENIPTGVAGVPPDYFSEDGQLWGNPLYDWDAMKKDGYKWWINRIDQASKLYDVIRIDHFRGFESYWEVPYGSITAKNGKWVKGPGLPFVKTITGWFSNVEFIAEDLGDLTQEVEDMLEASGLPGMRVMEFGLDVNGAGKNTPHQYVRNCVAYVGTHDNTTALGYLQTSSKANVKNAKAYLGIRGREPFNIGMIRGGMSSVANLFIAQMQDYLGLGDEAKINTPGTPSDNWTWRMKKDAYDEKLAKKIAMMTKLYERCA